MMKNRFIIILILLLTVQGYSQTYSGIVSDGIINELLISEIDNRPKRNEDQKLWKKRIHSKPISWTQAIIKLISSSPYDFNFQKTELISRDKQYNHELKKITELFTESDFEYMEILFNSELNNDWIFNVKKGKIKTRVKRNYYTYSIPLFDQKHEKAIIYFEFRGCGSVCGVGKILVYVKNNNKWNFYKSIPLWIS